MPFSPGPASSIRGLKSALALSTRGGSRVPELGTLGSVRGALSNERPYRDLRNVGENYPFERSHRFPVIQPNSGQGDHSSLSCSAGDKQLGAEFCRGLQQAFCTDVGHPCRHQSRDDAQMRMSELIALAFLAITGSAASGADSASWVHPILCSAQCFQQRPQLVLAAMLVKLCRLIRPADKLSA